MAGAVVFVCAAIIVATASAVEFECKDLHPDCPQWKRNMGGNCRGRDYMYMVKNCARTCGFCKEAEQKWKEEGKDKEMQDHYKILGVERDASMKGIKRAYRKLSVKYHPDKNKDEGAQAMFDAVADAYEVLGDEDKRQMYDNFGGQEFANKWDFDRALRQGKVKTGNFYDGSQLVTTLGNKNFGKTGRGAWLVKFYAPWCKHCQESVPDFKKAALHLDGDVKFGAVNCDDEQYTCNRYGIRSFPTLQFIYHKKDIKEIMRSEDHSVDAITRWIMQAKTNRMVDITPGNFEEKVIESNTLWLIDFSAGEWCGPCTMTKPAARKTASELHGIAKVGYINCDGDNQEFCSSQGVTYYPFLMVYPRGTPEMKREQKKELDGGMVPKQTLLDLFTSTAKAALSFREGFDANEFRERLMTFYEEHNPEKIETIDMIIDAYLGEEDYLWKQMHQKYELPYTSLEEILQREKAERVKMAKAEKAQQHGDEL